jgi:hypothetical protein
MVDEPCTRKGFLGYRHIMVGNPCTLVDGNLFIWTSTMFIESREDKENEDEMSSKDQVKRGIMGSQVFVKGGV